MDLELERACQIVATKDAQPLRRALFRRMAARSPALRLTLGAWDRLRGGPSATGFVSGIALKSFLEVEPDGTQRALLGVWQYHNEERQLDWIERLDPSLALTRLRVGAPRPAVSRLPWGELAEDWGLLDRYARLGDFLAAARVACTIGYYRRMLPLLAAHPARAVVVSSDTNPCAMALVAAARRLGRRTCFVTHGHVAEGPPLLDFDLALLDGPAVRAVYERAGPIRGRVVSRGSEGEARPMDTARLRRGVARLGVFLSILLDWRRVGAILERLRAAVGPERIVLRLHPNREMRDPRWAERLNLRGVEVSDGDRSFVDDAAGCALVCAGNSSVHLSVLKLGVPTLYVPGLDDLPHDYYRFVEDGIVTAAPGDGPIALERIAEHYEDPRWAERFARYDASWPDRQAACDAAVIEALQHLVRR